MAWQIKVTSSLLIAAFTTGCTIKDSTDFLNNLLPSKPQPMLSKSIQAKSYSKPRVERSRLRTSVAKVPAVTHKVQQGEWLYKIARDYNVTPSELMKLNNMNRSSQLSPGDVIIIKPATEVTSAENTKRVYGFTNRVTSSGSSKSLTATPQGKKEASLTPVVSKTKQTEEVVTFTTHAVKRGETLYRIGRQYNVSPFDLMAANEFDKPQDLKAGMRIQVPMTRRVVKGDVTSPIIREDLRRAKGMIWPAEGRVISRFGKKENGIENTGINIAVDEGAPVFAVDGGKVIYADSGLEKYGNLVLLRHKNGVITAYAHASRLRVKRGQTVAKGQVIALAGQTGNVDKPQLHFEVRRNARAINPLKVLPKKGKQG